VCVSCVCACVTVCVCVVFLCVSARVTACACTFFALFFCALPFCALLLLRQQCPAQSSGIAHHHLYLGLAKTVYIHRI
jgi:hypothetical protein